MIVIAAAVIVAAAVIAAAPLLVARITTAAAAIAKAAAVEKPGGSKKTGVPGKNKVVNDAVALAFKVKARYQAMQTAVDGLSRRIPKEAKFAWANNKEHIGDLTKKMRTCKDKFDTSTFATFVLTSSPAVVRAEYGDEYLQDELKEFMKLVQSLELVEAKSELLLSRSKVKTPRGSGHGKSKP